MTIHLPNLVFFDRGKYGTRLAQNCKDREFGVKVMSSSCGRHHVVDRRPGTWLAVARIRNNFFGTVIQDAPQSQGNIIIALYGVRLGSVVDSSVLNFEWIVRIGRRDHSLRSYIKHPPAISSHLKDDEH
jgi:hypothetical protein